MYSFRRMKVIHFVHSASGYSGACMQAISLAEALKVHGIEQCFVTTGCTDSKVTVHGLPMYSLGKHYIGRAYRFCKVLLRVQPDLVHFHGSDFLILLIAKIFRKPVYWKTTLNGSDDFGALICGPNGSIKRYLLQIIDCNNALTKQNYTVNKRYICETKIVVIPNGVAIPPRIDPDIKENLVLVVGAVIPRKRVKEAICFFKSNFRDQGYRMLVIGPADSSVEGFVQSYLAECFEEMDGSIEMIGHVDGSTLFSYYAKAKYLLHFSINEGMPNVVLEAMAWGVSPIVASMGGIAEELFSKSDCVRILDETTINRAYVVQLDRPNPTLCRQYVKERFGIDAVAAQTLEVYNRCVGKLCGNK
jgi:glycosyltransferase involved in cell wall biosynthesis